MTQDDITQQIRQSLDQITDEIISDGELCANCSHWYRGYPGTHDTPPEAPGCTRQDQYDLPCKHITEQLRQEYGR